MTLANKEYFAIKRKYPDAIVLFQVGEFLEAINGSAVTLSRIMGYKLTHTNRPQCGFKGIYVEEAVKKICKKGLRVAIVSSSN